MDFCSMVKVLCTTIATTIGQLTVEIGKTLLLIVSLMIPLQILKLNNFTDSILEIPLSTPGCEFQFGIYQDSEQCSTSYIKCEYGVPHVFPCQDGLVYDERIHGCNWPDQLLEKCNPEAVAGFACPIKVDARSLQARFWPYPRFAYSADAHKYIVCVEGNPRLISCGDDSLFDEKTLSCEEIDDE